MWKIVLAIILALTLIIAVALVYGHRRWHAAAKSAITKLEAARMPVEVKTYNPEELSDLPAPVQRYFHTVLKDGQRIITAVRLKQAGTFNMGESADQWKSFVAEQHIVTRQPGFIWDARITMLPGISALVHDAYAAGEGMLHASLFGLLTIADLRGTHDIAAGEFMRFFAEAAWYPTALLPSQGVQWEAVDDSSARATLTHCDLTATMLFHFDKNGFIESMHAKARGRTVGKQVIPTPWEGRWSNYTRRDVMLIPQNGEVSWILSEGAKPYWRGHITDIRYQFAE